MISTAGVLDARLSLTVDTSAVQDSPLQRSFRSTFAQARPIRVLVTTAQSAANSLGALLTPRVDRVLVLLESTVPYRMTGDTAEIGLFMSSGRPGFVPLTSGSSIFLYTTGGASFFLTGMVF